MLLLLRSVASGAAAASLGITLGLSAVAGTTATLNVTLGLTPPESIELNVFATPDIHFGLSGISSGFVSNSAILDTHLNLPAMGGFTASPTLGILIGLSGTVGGTLQGNASADIHCGLTGSLQVVPGATQTIVCGLAGTPTVSGGTLTPTANVDLIFTLAGQPVSLSAALCDLKLDLAAAGQFAIPTLATQMRLTFSSDEIRTFFWRG